MLPMNTISIPTSTPPKAREIAFLALLSAAREEKFIADSLDTWKQTSHPTDIDFHLARQLAYGTAKSALSLDHMASKIAKKRKLSLNLKERLILRLALYQYYYLERIPIYALSNESMKLAKKYCHRIFANFLNAILRQLPDFPFELPSEDSQDALSIRFSYPSFFVNKLLQDYSLDTSKEILLAGNNTPPIMARIRTATDSPYLKSLPNTVCSIGVLSDHAKLHAISSDPSYYIQNVTPATLITLLSKDVSSPKKILDLCASPGGKLIAVHDLFPDASLFANDVSQEKVDRLKENCSKYEVSPTFSCMPGESFTHSGLFDLIILDVPCSNTGVLSKRPEARWRINQESLDNLQTLQLKLLRHSASLLAPQGEIWYMTCSILKCENEQLVAKACEELKLHQRWSQSILPNSEGWDGGFACALKR